MGQGGEEGGQSQRTGDHTYTLEARSRTGLSKCRSKECLFCLGAGGRETGPSRAGLGWQERHQDWALSCVSNICGSYWRRSPRRRS